MRDHLQV